MDGAQAIPGNPFGPDVDGRWQSFQIIRKLYVPENQPKIDDTIAGEGIGQTINNPSSTRMLEIRFGIHTTWLRVRRAPGGVHVVRRVTVRRSPRMIRFQ